MTYPLIQVYEAIEPTTVSLYVTANGDTTIGGGPQSTENKFLHIIYRKYHSTCFAMNSSKWWDTCTIVCEHLY